MCPCGPDVELLKHSTLSFNNVRFILNPLSKLIIILYHVDSTGYRGSHTIKVMMHMFYTCSCLGGLRFLRSMHVSYGAVPMKPSFHSRTHRCMNIPHVVRDCFKELFPKIIFHSE